MLIFALPQELSLATSQYLWENGPGTETIDMSVFQKNIRTNFRLVVFIAMVYLRQAMEYLSRN